MQRQTMSHLHPANAQAIIEFAEETGAPMFGGTELSNYGSEWNWKI
jgi:hypothetical protein